MRFVVLLELDCLIDVNVLCLYVFCFPYFVEKQHKKHHGKYGVSGYIGKKYISLKRFIYYIHSKDPNSS